MAATIAVPGRIVIAFVAKLMLYRFQSDEGRISELLRILEKDWEDEGATAQPVADGRNRWSECQLAIKAAAAPWGSAPSAGSCPGIP